MSDEQMIQDILETVHFLRDNAVTKDEFHEEVNRLDNRINEVRDEMITHIDQFILLHNKLDTELVSLRSKCDRLESQLRQVFLHLNLQPIS